MKTTITDRLPTDTVAETVSDTAHRLVDLVPEGIPDTVQDVVTDGVVQGRRLGRRVTGRNDSSRKWLITAGIAGALTIVALVVWRARRSDRHLAGVSPDDWSTRNASADRSVA